MMIKLRPSQHMQYLLARQVPIQSLHITREEMGCIANDSKDTDQNNESALSHGLSGFTMMEMRLCCHDMT